jgi:transposase InsO family protein
MCRLAEVSRAGFYRHWKRREPRTEQTELRARIQSIVLAHRRNYGYRRVLHELRNQGWAVNHKRVARLMAEDNLLCLRKRRFVATTDSGHDLRVYLNLAARMELTGINQLWVADLTYIRLAEEFLYNSRAPNAAVCESLPGSVRAKSARAAGRGAGGQHEFSQA